MKKRVGIIGASGYTGHELLKILKHHSRISVEALNSRSFSGQKVSSLYRDFAGDDVYTDLSYKAINALKLDLIFLALPHRLSMGVVSKLDKNTRIIDLSADFRFQDPKLYEKVYDHKALYEKNDWIYGLPELFKEKISNARLVSNPGCYATCSILAAYPVRELAKHIIFDCKSGWSGAGRDSAYAKDPSKLNDNLIAYNIARHRHKYEIQQFIKTRLSFTPHVFNTFQGMMCTAHILLKKNVKSADVFKSYEEFYRQSPFVRIKHQSPGVSDTRKTNFCDIGGFEIDETNQLVIVATIDNLWKGASGQAVQNMNLMLGFNEPEGLL
jgi:N-acetyl-gamma-glutamyl-phosphate reductase